MFLFSQKLLIREIDFFKLIFHGFPNNDYLLVSKKLRHILPIDVAKHKVVLKNFETFYNSEMY